MNISREKYSPPSLEELYSRYSDMIYRIAFVKTGNAADADDVLQEVFLSYIRSKPEFADGEHLKAWLIRVAVNTSLNLLASAWRKRISDLPSGLQYEMPDSGAVTAAVLELPEKLRVAVHLFYYEGYSEKEIAKLTGSSVSAVKSRLFRARQILSDKLKEEI